MKTINEACNGDEGDESKLEGTPPQYKAMIVTPGGSIILIGNDPNKIRKPEHSVTRPQQLAKFGKGRSARARATSVASGKRGLTAPQAVAAESVQGPHEGVSAERSVQGGSR